MIDSCEICVTFLGKKIYKTIRIAELFGWEIPRKELEALTSEDVADLAHAFLVEQRLENIHYWPMSAGDYLKAQKEETRNAG